jgi:hypothetical protein
MKAFKRMKEKGGRAYGFQQSLRKFGAPEEFVEGLSLIRFLHRLGQKIQLRIVHRDVYFVAFQGNTNRFATIGRYEACREITTTLKCIPVTNWTVE